MKRLISLHAVIVQELGDRCGTSTTRDLKEIARRVEHEGVSFLTLTLPIYGKAFERWLSLGRIDSSLARGFKTHGRQGVSPQFLRGFLRLVFDEKEGRLLDTPSIEAIFAIRQITLMFNKILLPTTPERTRNAIDTYVETESTVAGHAEYLRRLDAGDVVPLQSDTASPTAYRRMANLLWGGLFADVDRDIHVGHILPKHGPGATADRLTGNGKYRVQTWTERLDGVFPHWEHLIPNVRFLDRVEDVVVLPPGAELPVRVITVPKTLKTPRIIAIEPTCMQFMQQGVLGSMMRRIREHDNSRFLMMFESQEDNRSLARHGSLYGRLATLDLSEASDRVSTWHVDNLLARHSLTREAVNACRSSKASVPGHGIIPLAKYASMGSALTFPLEAFVFTTVVFLGIERAYGRPLTAKDIASFYGKVRVYGDDIIVPTDYVQPVLESLEAYGFKVNHAKSFWTGRFRESCGTEWFAGEDVSISRCRRLLPDSRQDAQEVISVVSLRNQLYKAGLWTSAAYLDDVIGAVIPFPNVEETSSLLGRLSVFPHWDMRWDHDHHYPLVKGVVAVSNSPVDILDDYGALMKWFLRVEDASPVPVGPWDEASTTPNPFEDQNHLERAGRPCAVRIKTRWTRPW